MDQVLACIFDDEMETCFGGFHVYKVIWEAAVGEELECGREKGNRVDRYTVAVVKDGMYCRRFHGCAIEDSGPSGFGSSFLVAGLKYCSNTTVWMSS